MAERHTAALAAALLSALMPGRAGGQTTESILAPEVLITASRAPVARVQAASAVSVITAEDIARRQAIYVVDVLRDVPGLALARSGGPGTNVQVRIRGAESNHTLVLIDGIEANDPAISSDFDFAHILAADVERIEIVRGPQSALWGSDALGGVVNIVTKRGAGRPRVSGAAEIGSFSTTRQHAALRGGGDGYHYAASLSHLKTNGVSVARGGREKDGYENTTASFVGGAALAPNLGWKLVGRIVDANADNDPQPFPSAIPVDAEGYATHVRQIYLRTEASLGLFDGAWEQIVGAALTDHDNRFDDPMFPTASNGRKEKLDYQSNFRFDTPELAEAAHTLILLAEVERERFEQGGFFAVDRRVTNYGYVGEYRVDLWERLSLSGALRHDDNDIFRDATTWRATAAYRVRETDTRLRASYGTGVKNPTFFELFGFTPTFRGNPDLKPERSEGYDVGIEQRFWDGRARLELTWFEQELTDEIFGAGPMAFNFDGKSRRRGIEAEAALQLLPGLDLHAAYAWLRAREPDGSPEIRRPKHSGSAHLNWRFLEDRANLNLGVRWNGAREDFNFATFPPGRVTLDGYALVDLASSYRLSDGIELFGRIENLLDENYEEVFGYNTPGIAGYAGIRVGFGL